MHRGFQFLLVVLLEVPVLKSLRQVHCLSLNTVLLTNHQDQFGRLGHPAIHKNHFRWPFLYLAIK